jgi:hypothetical protein
MRIRLFASFQLFTGRFHEPGRGPRSSSITNDESRRRAADPEVPRLRTWVSIMVVVTSLWPSSSWIVRMSWPRSSRWVVNEWRNRILPGQGIGHQDAAPPCGQLWGKSVMRSFPPLPSRTVSPSRADRSSRCGAPTDVYASPPGTAGSALAAGCRASRLCWGAPWLCFSPLVSEFCSKFLRQGHQGPGRRPMQHPQPRLDSDCRLSLAAGCPDLFSPSPCERLRRHSRPHDRASRC